LAVDFRSSVSIFLDFFWISIHLIFCKVQRAQLVVLRGYKIFTTAENHPGLSPRCIYGK
jgi:hypothetical protein